MDEQRMHCSKGLAWHAFLKKDIEPGPLVPMFVMQPGQHIAPGQDGKPGQGHR
jgi:hypothetical protein